MDHSVDHLVQQWEQLRHVELDCRHVEIGSNLAGTLAQSREWFQLKRFVTSLSTDEHAVLYGNERFLKALIRLYQHEERYQDAVSLIKNGTYRDPSGLLESWDLCQYKLREKVTGRPLTSLDRFRVRKRNPPPVSICPEGCRPSTRPHEHEVSILRSWFHAHRSNPYPTVVERRMLVSASGISDNQVKMWFCNARRRLKLSQSKRQTRKSEADGHEHDHGYDEYAQRDEAAEVIIDHKQSRPTRTGENTHALLDPALPAHSWPYSTHATMDTSLSEESLANKDYTVRHEGELNTKKSMSLQDISLGHAPGQPQVSTVDIHVELDEIRSSNTMCPELADTEPNRNALSLINTTCEKAIQSHEFLRETGRCLQKNRKSRKLHIKKSSPERLNYVRSSKKMDKAKPEWGLQFHNSTCSPFQSMTRAAPSIMFHYMNTGPGAASYYHADGQDLRALTNMCKSVEGQTSQVSKYPSHVKVNDFHSRSGSSTNYVSASEIQDNWSSTDFCFPPNVSLTPRARSDLVSSVSW